MSEQKLERCASCGQLLPSDDRRKSRRFAWGIGLSLLTLIPAAVGLGNAFRGIASQKATGLGAVAGGFSEIGIVAAFLWVVVFPIAAIVLLAGSFSKGRTGRGILAVLGIGWSILVLLLVSVAAFALSMAWRSAHQG